MTGKTSYYLLNKIITSFQHFLDAHNLKVPIKIEIIKNYNLGHFASNLSFLVCKQFKQDPVLTGLVIKNFLLKDNPDLFKSINVIKPGFINLTINHKYFTQVIKNVLTNKSEYGKPFIQNDTPLFYVFEMVSANPTGLLHIGHARNGCIAMALLRLFKFFGYKVISEHYTNDAGVQIQNLALTVFIYYLRLVKKNTTIPLPDICYKGDIYAKLAQNLYEEIDDRFVNSEYNETELLDKIANLFFKEQASVYFLNRIKKDLAKINVTIDHFISEKQIYDEKLIQFVLKKIENEYGLTWKDNAVWLKTSEYGDSKDRVLIKSDKTYTYSLPDIANHFNRFNKYKPDGVIDFWGADHHGYIKRIKIGLKMCGIDENKLEIILIQMVKIMRNKEILKMSKRQGTSITISELYKEIGSDALVFSMCSKASTHGLTINIEEFKTQSENNPVFYIDYAMARINSLLKLGKVTNYQIKNNQDYQKLTNENEINIIKTIATFPKIISNAVQQRAPYVICEYMILLSKLFHAYYNHHKIVQFDQKELSWQRLDLSNAILQILETCAKLIGISIVQKM